MKHLTLIALLTIIPSLGQAQDAPGNTTPGSYTAAAKKKTATAAARSRKSRHHYGSNVGAVNEGGGSANTTGMNSGLSPHGSGSGTDAMDASRARAGKEGTPPAGTTKPSSR